MIEPLLMRLTQRVLFVVGKGGVGKTTTAGAIALALADRGATVHLVSTDPAHSLADLFGGLPQPCSARLTVEEFDARTYADTYFRRVRPALVTLFETGTYLDAADAAGFLDLSVPGIDEIMAALRLVDLVRGPSDRIVVDTAPTGHTLRLLESAAILRSWVAAGRAMADKGAAVASQLMRQTVRFPAEDVLDEMLEYADAFEQDVLRASSFLVVTRPGRVVAAETERLEEQLKRRNVSIAVTVGDELRPAWLPDATGCDGLRASASHFDENPLPVRVRPSSEPRGDAGRELVHLSTRLVWVAGKGGVGKSTVAAALAAGFAESRNVRIVSTDPAGSLSEVYGADVSGTGSDILPRLHARQIDAPAEFARMRNDYNTAVERVFEALGLDHAVQLDRKVIAALFNFAPPGIDEIIALIEIMDRIDEFDVTVIDSAPTGHFLRLLAMPEIALEWVHALMRLLVKYHALASLDALAHDLLAFSKRLRQLKLDLSTPETTAIYVVALAEPMVIAETQRLCAALNHAHIPIAAIILNRAEAGRARELRDVFAPYRIIRAADAGSEITGVSALQDFLSQWEKLG